MCELKNKKMNALEIENMKLQNKINKDFTNKNELQNIAKQYENDLKKHKEVIIIICIKFMPTYFFCTKQNKNNLCWID